MSLQQVHQTEWRGIGRQSLHCLHHLLAVGITNDEAYCVHPAIFLLWAVCWICVDGCRELGSEVGSRRLTTWRWDMVLRWHMPLRYTVERHGTTYIVYTTRHDDQQWRSLPTSCLLSLLGSMLDFRRWLSRTWFWGWQQTLNDVTLRYGSAMTYYSSLCVDGRSYDAAVVEITIQ